MGKHMDSFDIVFAENVSVLVSFVGWMGGVYCILQWKDGRFGG